MTVPELLALAGEPDQHGHRQRAAVDELGRRRSPERRGLLLTLLVDTDLHEGLRLQLLSEALRDGGATAHAAWWVMTHTEYGWLEHGEYLFEAVRMLGELDGDQGGEGQALTSILADERLSGRLRALAGADLLELLGPAGMPLLAAHLGDRLVEMLEEAGDDSRVLDLLSSIADDRSADPALRLEAAEASLRLSPDGAEHTFAGLALADGFTLEQRMDALEQAVELADSSAALAAIEILRVLVPPHGPAVDHEALSRALGPARDRS